VIYSILLYCISSKKFIHLNLNIGGFII